MKAIDYLKMAKNSDNRKTKVENLFKYFELMNIKKTYYSMIDYIAKTDEQLQEDIEGYLIF